eukprot:353182-Chlamydomonas_euryale.AAC.32
MAEAAVLDTDAVASRVMAERMCSLSAARSAPSRSRRPLTTRMRNMDLKSLVTPCLRYCASTRGRHAVLYCFNPRSPPAARWMLCARLVGRAARVCDRPAVRTRRTRLLSMAGVAGSAGEVPAGGSAGGGAISWQNDLFGGAIVDSSACTQPAVFAPALKEAVEVRVHASVVSMHSPHVQTSIPIKSPPPPLRHQSQVVGVACAGCTGKSSKTLQPRPSMT